MTQQTRTRLTLLTLMGLTMVRLPLALALRTLLPDASVNPEMNYVASILQSLLMFALPALLLMPLWRRGEAEKKWSPGGCLLLAGIAVLARLVATPLNAEWAQMLGAPMAALPAVDGPAGMVLMLLAAVVIPAVAEELFFRGALLTNLLRSGSRMQALVLTTVMFALMHGSLAGLPGHLIISLLLTLLMMHIGHLAAPMAAHMLYNLLALGRWELGQVVPWVLGGMLAVLLGWLLMRLPRGQKRRLLLTEWLLCAVILLAMALQYLI